MAYCGTLFMEAACRIWCRQGRCEDKIYEAVSKLLFQRPQLLGRMTRFLRAIDFDHEIDALVDEICDRRASLSASDPSWLDWCQPRVMRPESYGKRMDILTRCMDVLFHFLDYGSNRGCARAWVLLYAVVQLMDNAQLVPYWACRYDWWPRFHTVPLSLEAESRRSELLRVLAAANVG